MRKMNVSAKNIRSKFCAFHEERDKPVKVIELDTHFMPSWGSPSITIRLCEDCIRHLRTLFRRPLEVA